MSSEISLTTRTWARVSENGSESASLRARADFTAKAIPPDPSRIVRRFIASLIWKRKSSSYLSRRSPSWRSVREAGQWTDWRAARAETSPRASVTARGRISGKRLPYVFHAPAMTLRKPPLSRPARASSCPDGYMGTSPPVFSVSIHCVAAWSCSPSADAAMRSISGWTNCSMAPYIPGSPDTARVSPIRNIVFQYCTPPNQTHWREPVRSARTRRNRDFAPKPRTRKDRTSPITVNSRRTPSPRGSPPPGAELCTPVRVSSRSREMETTVVRSIYRRGT